MIGRPRLRLGVTPALGEAAVAVGSAAAEFVYVNFLLAGILTTMDQARIGSQEFADIMQLSGRPNGSMQETARTSVWSNNQFEVRTMGQVRE